MRAHINAHFFPRSPVLQSVIKCTLTPTFYTLRVSPPAFLFSRPETFKPGNYSGLIVRFHSSYLLECRSATSPARRGGHFFFYLGAFVFTRCFYFCLIEQKKKHGKFHAFPCFQCPTLSRLCVVILVVRPISVQALMNDDVSPRERLLAVAFCALNCAREDFMCTYIFMYAC